MNLITLVHEKELSVTSGKLVYRADETDALKSVLETAEALVDVHAKASEKIAVATESGREQGFKEGYEAGQQAARKQISTQLLQMAQQFQLDLEQQREHTVELALQIVRKIAAGIAPEETLAALARIAAKSCLEDESITLHVHPKHKAAVQARLQADNPSATKPLIVTEDASLDENGCVLATRHGSVLADLETQLQVIQQNLADND